MWLALAFVLKTGAARAHPSGKIVWIKRGENNYSRFVRGEADSYIRTAWSGNLILTVRNIAVR
jgi:hypothetical protein